MRNEVLNKINCPICGGKMYAIEHIPFYNHEFDFARWKCANCGADYEAEFFIDHYGKIVVNEREAHISVPHQEMPILGNEEKFYLKGGIFDAY